VVSQRAGFVWMSFGVANVQIDEDTRARVSSKGMRVRVLYFGVLKEIFGRESEWMEMAEPARVRDVLNRCEERGAGLSSIAVAVNQEYAKAEDALRDGDEVALLPPVSGGLR